jgi:hypothetical protein
MGAGFRLSLSGRFFSLQLLCGGLRLGHWHLELWPSLCAVVDQPLELSLEPCLLPIVLKLKGCGVVVGGNGGIKRSRKLLDLISLGCADFHVGRA